MYEAGRVVEFFAGIGGWHFALSNIFNVDQYKVIASIEININAKEVYKTNFPGTKILCNDIRYIKLLQFIHFKADTWVMSPPCQPYTSLGKQLDSGFYIQFFILYYYFVSKIHFNFIGIFPILWNFFDDFCDNGR